ncbi:tetratricopeptide repeat protein [Pseudomonas alcaligenes]|uniref:tetratricopeptide repeat protein n=1 Tax=Aquipseudomonas alcaligenes TaxID=43263 RepID=UPI002E7AEDF8|nr:tetratricopeptide repeat protein [Pseudomonas alcaligenes]MEE1948662.1 tetratricopeptide repeat protein [Pseudomonas alcaligenes]
MIGKTIKQTLLTLLLISNHTWASLTPEQKQARDDGIILYNQHRGISAVEPLRTAAKAGDASAQYYLGETLRLNAMYMTPEAAKWYEAAANQGNLYAMLRLSSAQDLCTFLTDCAHDAAEWREKAIEQGHQRAERGDTSAMIALYLADQGLDWLEKAAELDDHYAQYLLAGFYRDGDGWFLVPGKREETIRQLLKSAAVGGFPLAMMRYLEYLSEEKDAEEMRTWITRSAEEGYVNGVFSLAAHSAHMPPRFGFPQDRIKAYGLFYLLSQLEGGGGVAQDAQYELNEIRPLMKEDEIARAIQFSKEWEASHPPLSYFVPLYGF